LGKSGSFLKVPIRVVLLLQKGKPPKKPFFFPGGIFPLKTPYLPNSPFHWQIPTFLPFSRERFKPATPPPFPHFLPQTTTLFSPDIRGSAFFFLEKPPNGMSPSRKTLGLFFPSQPPRVFLFFRISVPARRDSLRRGAPGFPFPPFHFRQLAPLFPYGTGGGERSLLSIGNFFPPFPSPPGFPPVPTFLEHWKEGNLSGRNFPPFQV